MFRYACVIFLSLFLTQPNPVNADDPLGTVLGGLQKRYSHIPGFTVPYKREIITRSMAMLGGGLGTDTATGRIHFKPPHFLRIQQETPKPESVITEGQFLWWYIPHKRQVYRYPFEKLGVELRLLMDIFQGLRKAQEAFNVSLRGDGKKGEHLIRLVPDPPWPQVDHINLSVDRENYGIRMVEIHNLVGGITRFFLGDLMEEKAFEEGFFRFVVPDGVKVIEEK